MDGSKPAAITSLKSNIPNGETDKTGRRVWLTAARTLRKIRWVTEKHGRLPMNSWIRVSVTRKAGSTNTLGSDWQ